MPKQQADADGRVFDRDRGTHLTHRPDFKTRIGTVAFAPDLRKAAAHGKNDWCRFVMFERGIDPDTRGKYERKWAVYAFSELARFACACIRPGDRVIVHGYERGTNTYPRPDGTIETIEDITAWDIGQSMLRNPAFSERNENNRYTRNQRRVEEGYRPVPNYNDRPDGAPPA